MTAPAYLLDRLWRARAWNAPAARALCGWLGGGERCLLDYVFLDRAARAFIVDWENRARRLVAEFRADTGRNPDDPALSALVDRLRTGSADFAKFWGDHAVLAREGGARTFNHPRDGLRHYEQVTLAPAGRPDTKLVMLLPSQRSPSLPRQRRRALAGPTRRLFPDQVRRADARGVVRPGCTRRPASRTPKPHGRPMHSTIERRSPRRADPADRGQAGRLSGAVCRRLTCSTESTASNSPPSPAPATAASSIAGVPFERIASRSPAAFQTAQHIGNFREDVESPIEIHQTLAQAGAVDRQRLQREIERASRSLHGSRHDGSAPPATRYIEAACRATARPRALPGLPDTSAQALTAEVRSNSVP